MNLRRGRYGGYEESGEGEEEGDKKAHSARNHLIITVVTFIKESRLKQKCQKSSPSRKNCQSGRNEGQTFGDIRKDPQDDKTHRQL